MHRSTHAARLLAALLFLIAPFSLLHAQNNPANIAATDVFIDGSSLALEDVTATTALTVPVNLQTSFGGLKNELAPIVPELTAVGELTGPGLATPLRLETRPGHSFTIPGLTVEGTYLLQNVRLMRGTTFVQNAVPSAASITVTDILKTKVSVRQLTAAELRARGINIDARNFDVFEYTLSFFVGEKEIVIPFPVIIDNRTHEIRPVATENPYGMPGPKGPEKPPRWSPPGVQTLELIEGGGLPPQNEQEAGPRGGGGRRIPAAIVIPNSLGVLHQFFAVALNVTNDAPAGSAITLDSITATMKNPAELRVADTKPAVSIGRPLPLVDPNTGATFLIAQGKAEAGWTLEGLKTGTHTFTIEVNATYKQTPESEGIPLRGTVSQSIVIHDPRFNITFSHPDTVRSGLTYSTFTFVTNMTSANQTLRLGTELPACSSAVGASVCRLDDDINSVPTCSGDPKVDLCRPAGTQGIQELTLKPGATRTLIYKLRSSLTGNIFATAGSVDSDAIHASVQLHMGVSQSGIPLSPATLIMPYYAQYLDDAFVTDNLQLLGLGYSLATAPVNQVTAKFPRVIKTDVFRRAVDIARTGQRVFIGEEKRDAFAHLALDLLGNSGTPHNDLEEWDQLRRAEYSGRLAGAALARQFEKSALKTGADFDTFLPKFGTATAHRAPFLTAVTYGAPVSGNTRPYALSVRGRTTRGLMDLPNELATEDALGKRDVAYGDLSRVKSEDNARTGELAMVGVWNEDFDLVVTPVAGSSFTLEVLYKSPNAARIKRALFNVTGASGRPLTVALDPTASQLVLTDGTQSFSATPSEIQPPPIVIIAAHQDMHLDQDGHKVSVLFNRPVVSEGVDFKPKFAGRVIFQKDAINYTGPRGVDAAAMQEDGRTLNLTFDHSLSKNASYRLTVQPLTDLLTNASVTFPELTPVLENDNPAGIVYGRVLRGDNTPVPNAQVVLKSSSEQYDVSSADKAEFLFEYVLRDLSRGYGGAFNLSATDTDGKFTALDGAVRLTGVVETVNLVYLGRGSAEGIVTYDNGERVANARVVVGSSLFNQFRTTQTNADGSYKVEDLPVGPLTFSATDIPGNTTFAATEIRSPGEVIHQDLSIYRKPFPGTGTIRGIVLRSDTNAPVVSAHVGVYSQGYGLVDGHTGSDGRFEFTRVPAGLVTALASEWGVSRQSVGVDFELAPDQVKDLTLTLNVAPNESLVNLEGDVEEEDALAPGTYHKVPNALVQIDKAQVVTADANGHFFYNAIPQSFAGRTIKAYNPASKRIGETTVPTLNPSTTTFLRIPIHSSNAYGSGTIRVRVLNAAGLPVSNYRVMEPGFPPIEYRAVGNGYYELTGVPVGADLEIWALPTNSSRDAYGEQMASGRARVAFNGQTALLVLRLAGQGKIRARLITDTIDFGDVNITYSVWDEAEQNPQGKTFTRSTRNGEVAGYAVFEKVPVGDIPVFASLAGIGYGSENVKLVYDGQIIDVDLLAKKLATISGAVYAIDGITPMPGVPVKMTEGVQIQGPLPTLLDGSFKFSNVAAGAGFSVTAEATQGGIYRVGRADGGTPGSGGPVRDVRVVMKQQGSVEGRVVYAGYKVFDPADSSKNVVDPTPNDPSDNAPVPLARFYLRELSFPYRSFGEERASLAADIAGRFLINNVFEGPVRLTAWSPQNQDLRGHGQVSVTQEGETVTVYAQVGTEGFGPLLVTVVNPNKQNQPVENAEVSLLIPNCCGPDIVFDFGTTDANGAIQFEQVPARNNYRVAAFSKALGNSGEVSGVSVLPLTGGSTQVSLQFSGTVDGMLSDPQAGGAGVPGVPIRLTATTYQQQASSQAGADAGKFFFGGIREGAFTLSALHETSRRIAKASGFVSAANPHPTVNLELEPITSLHVKVYYPNDNGTQSNVEVPVALVGVKQRCRGIIGGEICEYWRELQGNEFVFTSLFRNEGYGIWVREIGGQQRTTGGGGSFPLGETAGNPIKFTLPAFGSVEVTVRQPGDNGVLGPAAGARVSINGTTVTTDTNGVAVINGVALGNFSVGAVSFDGAFSAYSQTLTLSSQTVQLKTTLDLGAYAGVSGKVIAEEGGPSVNTRVLASFAGRLATVFTDADGAYKFQGVPVSTTTSTTVSLTFFGPDDRTVGAAMSRTLTVSDASKIVPLPDVKIDATPPAVVSITPADNSVDVSPDSSVRIVFTEPVAQSTINLNNFRLFAADGSAAVNVFFTRSIGDDGKLCTVTMTPPASTDPQQKFPLKSNMLYRVLLTGGITDERGHPLIPRGFSFITADYVAPKVIQVKPALGVPLSASTTFEVHFNKALATKSLPDSPTPVPPLVSVRLYKISGFGGNIIEEKAGSLSHNQTYTQLFFGPSQVLDESTHYRLVLQNVRDEIGNVADPITYEWISYDKTPPFITFDAPVPTGQPLVSGVRYTLKAVLRNGSATGEVATDVGRVDFFRVENGAKSLLASLTKAPFEYTFVGPNVTTTGSTLTFRAEAMDTSLNNATPQEITFDLAPNRPPQNVKLTLDTAGSIYAGSRVVVRPSLEDEGVLVTLQAQLTGTKSDGTAYQGTRITGQATRPKVGDPWTFTPATFTFDVPTDLQDGSAAAITITAADGVNEIVSGESATFVVASDTTEPVITSLTVSPASPYHLGDKYTITAIAKDLESGVSEVVFSYDGKTITLRPGDAGVVALAEPRTYRFTTAQITVPAKNDDTRIPILATAKDYRANKSTAATEVTYIGVHDETLPKGAWISPIANAAWPSEQTAFATTLRFWAKDDDAITGVKFVVPGIADPVTAAAAGNDTYEATVNVATPLAGTAFTLTALVDDANAAHTQTISIPVTLVKIDTTLGPNFTQAITSTGDALAGKNVLVKGPNAHLVMHVPFTFRNLIVIDGAMVETLATTTTLERKLDLTVTDTLYVDSTSIVDVAGRGYVGGWGVNGDGSNTKNEDSRGRTVGNTVNGGPTSGSAASHGGVGGEYGGTTNRTYGSLAAPTQLGTGGAGAATCCNAGGAGGGAASIAGGSAGADLARIILAGTIRADGNGGYSAGSGGSIRLRGNMVSLGRNARVSANGGDEGGADNASRGAGGGRISIVAAQQLDLVESVTQLLARGGRNLGADAKTYLDGGAGTIYIRRPGQAFGELVVSGIDTNNRQTRPTILGYTGSGTSSAVTANTLTDSSRTFASEAVGEELILAGDTTKSYTITAVSGGTLTTDSADGSLLDASGASSGVVDYAGLLAFDAVRVEGRALARFDNALAIGGAVDDRTKAIVTAPSVLLLRNQFPSVTLTTNPPTGGSLIRGSSFTATYSASSDAGIGRASFAFSPVASPIVDPYNDYRGTASATNRVIAIPPDAALGNATLDLTATDRSGRTAKAAQQLFTIIENAEPLVTRFDVVPDTFYPGRNVVATVSASDDVAVTKITVTSTIGTTPSVQTITPNAKTVTDQTFTFNVPITTPGATPMKIDLAVEDGFAGRAPVTRTKSLTILKDVNPPSITITEPEANKLFQEQGGQTLTIKATVTDAEVGVKTVTVKVGEGSPVAMVPDATVPNGWKASVLLPNVDGADIVSFPIVVTASDYESNQGTASSNFRVQPYYDPNGPVIAILCPTADALVPAGYPAKLRVYAIGNNVNNPSNLITKVEFFINDSTTPVPAPAVSGVPNAYEGTFNVPSTAAEGEVFTVRAVATNTASLTSDYTTRFTIVSGTVITSDRTVSDASLDDQTVIVQSGTLTLNGARRFTRLIVLDGGRVTHTAADGTYRAVDLNVTDRIYISCGGSIDGQGRGYTGSSNGFGRTQTGSSSSRGGAGGSHGGPGGGYDYVSGSTYGSVLDPNTPGGAGGGWNAQWDCTTCGSGGGIVRIKAATITNNGSINANGAPYASQQIGLGAGGSVRVDVGTLGGTGTISANGGLGPTQWGGGGGGRVAVYYQSLGTFDRAKITAAGTKGNNGNTNNLLFHGSNGTVYYRLVDASGNKISDELVLDNTGNTTALTTTLPKIGTGTVTAVNGSTLTLSGPVETWTEGATIEVLDAAGAVKSTHVVAQVVSSTSVILAAPAANVAAGDAYRGAWRFDAVTARNNGTVISDGLNTPLVTTSTSGYIRFNRFITAPSATIKGLAQIAGTVKVPQLTVDSSGKLEVDGTVDSTNITTKNGGTLEQLESARGTTTTSLTIKADAITIEPGSAIDATGSGYIGSSNGFGSTHASASASRGGAGGSHGGRGGGYDYISGTGYGSVFDPNTAGGAGGGWNAGWDCSTCAAGGGILRINAKTITNNGAISANGAPYASTQSGMGAGGSIRLDVETLSGTGTVSANGGMGPTQWGGGGGGRIAVYYRDLASFDRAKITAYGTKGNNGNTNNLAFHGSNGTIYYRQLDASGNKVSDELVLDNAGNSTTYTTELARTGTGTITAINGATLTVSGPVAAWTEGATLEILDATGAVKSAYPIASRVSNTSIILALPSGVSVPNANVGDAYRGAWRFDLVTARALGNIDSDGLSTPSITTAGSSFLRFDRLIADALTVRGWIIVLDKVKVPQLTVDGGGKLEVSGTIEATNIAVKGNSTIEQLESTRGTTTTSLTIKADAITIEPGSAIDATGSGYIGSSNGFGSTHASASASRGGAGGSHGGRGGGYDYVSGTGYGSVFDPNTAGGAGGGWNAGWDCSTCAAGGGILRINAKTITNNGAISANGAPYASTQSGMGAGGSIRLDVETLSGTGTVSANGGMGPTQWGGGGGGRIAVYYRDLASFDRAKITAYGTKGNNGNTNNLLFHATNGTIYYRQLDASGSKVSDELVLDNAGNTTGLTTDLARTGTGTIAAINGATLTVSGPVAAWTEGAYFEILDAAGAIKSAYPIASRVSNTSVILALPSGVSAPNAAVGDAYRGGWRFDAVTARANANLESDQLTTPAISTSGSSWLKFDRVVADALTVRGWLTVLDKLKVPQLTLNGNAKVDANGRLETTDLLVKGNSTLAQLASTKTEIRSLTIDASNSITVETGSAISATGAGYTGSGNGFGSTQPGESQGRGGAGGSHAGRGGSYDYVSGSTYGSIFNPNTPGGAGAGWNAHWDCASCAAGGGVLRVLTKTLTLNGALSADGAPYASTQSGMGAGGSVRVDVETLTGGGSISANGGMGPTQWGGGGGGRVAVYYQSLGTFDRAKITAFGTAGNNGNTNNRLFHGAPGTVYLKAASQTYGDLVIDNNGLLSTVTPSKLTSVGYRTVDEFTASSVRDIGASLAMPSQLTGIRLFVNGNKALSWPILTNTAETVNVDVSANPLATATGQQFRGLQKFDSVTLKFASIDIEDVLESVAPLSKDASSSILGNNEGAPLVDPAKITIQTSPTGASVIGTANAIVDPDKPLTFTLINARTSGTFTGSVGNDGSFVGSVTGNAGDQILLKAKDGSIYPLESAPVAVGTLPSSTPTPSQINKSDWAASSAFQADTLSLDGKTLAIAPHVNISGADSPQVVFLDLSDPSRPALRRTVSTVNRVLDVTVVNGFAYVAGDRFGTIDAENPSAAMAFAADICGRDYSVAVSGGYAFTGEVDCNNNGMINIYDVSTPSAPRYLRQQAVAGFGDIAFHDLLAYGTDYLVAISGTWGGSGRDVIVVDRRDVNNLVKVSELLIPDFTAWRGKIAGTKLYLADKQNAKMAVVDLTNPAAPVTAGVLAVTAPGSGVDVVGNDVLLAASTAGLVTTTADPASLRVTGSVGTSGNAGDVVTAFGYAYVANRIGIAVIPISVAPTINANRITLGYTGSSVTVTGAIGSVTGTSVKVKITDTTSNASIDGINVAADGSFPTTSLPASSGDAIALTATDALGRVAGPVSLGNAPFGTSVAAIPVVNPGGDGDWRARTIKAEGNNLAVSAFPATFGDSSRIVLYDISNPAAPVFKRTMTTINRVLDFDIVGGYAYVAGDRFGTIDLNNPSSTIVAAADICGRDYSVAVAGGYAFTGEVDCNNNGMINIYDVSNPAAPRYIRQQSVAGIGSHAFTDLLVYGDYLIGVSSWGGPDVMVIDRRDINSLSKVSQLNIPQIDAFRGKISGNKLYLGSWTGGSAIVDLSNPAAPVVMATSTSSVMARGVEITGSTMALANGGSGVQFFDVSANTLVKTGTQVTGGTAWDVAFARGSLYVANDQGIVVINNVSAPPQIDTRLISVSASSETLATVAGAANAVTGLAPLSVEVKNGATGAAMTVTAQSNGSFSASVPASAGESLTVKVTDASSRSAGPVLAGTMPFGSAVTSIPIVNPGGDTDWRARTIKAEGNNLAVSAFPATFGDSSRIVLYDISNPAAPVFKRTLTTINRVLDFDIVGGYAYVAGDRFGTIDLNNPSSTIVAAADICGRDYSVAVSGGYAFTGEVDCNNNGMINIYDVSNPAAPRYIRQQSVAGIGGHAFTDLLAYGPDYLIGVSSWGGPDVMVIDRRDINNLKKVTQLNIPQIDAFRGKISGNKLYLGSWTGGSAIVDLSNPAAPAIVATASSPAHSRGVDVAGSTMALANAGLGVQFFDVTSTLLSRGWQPTGGVAWDVVLSRGMMYVAADQGIVVVQNVAAAPQIDTRLISVTSNGTDAIVTGAAAAITGQGTLTADVKDTASGFVKTVTVQSDGSFTAMFASAAGSVLTLKATDGNGRTAGPVNIGAVPFGTNVKLIPISSPNGQSDWRARTIKVEGNNLAMAAFPAESFGDSSQLVVYDITNASSPVHKRSVSTINRILDFDIVGGYAYVAGDRFGTIDLNNPTATIAAAADICGRDYSVAVSGGYAFTGEVDCNNNGTINIYDVSDPATPRYLRQQAVAGFGGHAFTDLIPYGNEYLIGISSWGGPDVMIIDRRDVNGLFKVSELQIPQMDAFRGKLVGTKLYLSSWGAGTTAIVDVSNPAAPVQVALAISNGPTRGVDLAGATMALASNSQGVELYDVSAGTLRSLGFQSTGGVAWDVAFAAGNLYVAADQGLVVIENAGVAPDVDPSRISISTIGGGSATVTGTARAIGGVGTTTLSIANPATGVSVNNVSVNADGSFTASIPAQAGHKLNLTASDAASRVSTRAIGSVPFASITREFRGMSDSDGNILARRIISDGTAVVAGTGNVVGYVGGSGNTMALLAGQTTPSLLLSAAGAINGMTMRGSWGYFAADRLSTVNFGSATPVRILASGDPCGRDMSIAVIGNYAYTGEGGCNDNARINIWNVTDPAAPSLVNEQSFNPGGTDYLSLIPGGTNTMIGLTSNAPGQAGDVAIFDLTNPTSISRVKVLDIPNFAGNYGAYDAASKTLYVASYSPRAIAVVDLTTPANPVIRSTITPPGFPMSIAVSGPNEIVVADGSSGLTFIDTTDKTAPVILGTQQLPGNAKDVKVIGNTIYAATETRMLTLQRP